MSEFFADLLKWWPIVMAVVAMLVWAITQSIWLALKISKIDSNMVTKDECNSKCSTCRSNVFGHVRDREDKIISVMNEMRADLSARMDTLTKLIAEK